MKKMFNGFMAAEGKAESIARRLILKGEYSCLGIELIKARNNGNPFTDKEKREVQYVYNSALVDMKRRVLTKMIMKGVVPDCIMTREFMSGCYKYAGLR